MIKIYHKLIAFSLILLLAGCKSGGITIPQSDSTPPTLTLSAGQPNGGSATVSVGGSDQSMMLISKTGPLNLTATAEDLESGIQSLQIWVNQTSTTCNATCTSSGPGLLTAPEFESTSPQKKPGEKTVAMSVLADALDLSKLIPQGSVSPGKTFFFSVLITAKAVNHLGGTAQTAQISADWKEP